MVGAPLNIRADRDLCRLFGSFALYILCMGIVIGWDATAGDTSVVRESARIQLFIVIGLACFLSLTTGFVYFRCRRWSLTSDGIKIIGLFRCYDIPWCDVASLRIESFNEGTTHRLMLRESSGEEFTINMAEVVLKGKGRVPATEWQLPEEARDKTDIVVNPAPNWGQLVAMMVFGVTIMVWLAVQIRSMAPQ